MKTRLQELVNKMQEKENTVNNVTRTGPVRGVSLDYRKTRLTYRMRTVRTTR